MGGQARRINKPCMHASRVQVSILTISRALKVVCWQDNPSDMFGDSIEVTSIS